MSLIEAARACIVSRVTDDAWNVITVDEVFGVGLRGDKYVCSCGEMPCAHAVAVALERAAPVVDMRDEMPVAELDVTVERVPAELPQDLSLYDDAVIGPLPAWVGQIRPHQAVAVDQILDEYARGADVVVLDAPTGSGKTLIAELVRRALDTRGVYVCSTTQLQDQFMRDFPYAKMLKGRANYPTQNHKDSWPRLSGADCMGEKCAFCKNACPYLVARAQAVDARLTVLNTAYLLSSANYTKRFKDNAFVVVDECDTLEDVLMRFVEFRVPHRVCKELYVDVPKKGSHKTTISAWLTRELVPAVERESEHLRKNREKNAKDITFYEYLARSAKSIATRMESKDEADNWIRDNDAGPMVLRPITVNRYAPGMLWSYGGRWLLMSASVISTQEMMTSLGMEDLRVETVTVPMTFPVENRQVHVAGVAKMTRDAKSDGGWMRVAKAIELIADRHRGVKVLVHTVSYELARYLEAEYRNSQLPHRRKRPSYTYTNTRAKGEALVRWRCSADGVMFAPSLDRGVDLVDDDCRVQIIAKVPFPYLGDPQISTRLNSGREGAQWYAVKAVRTLVQMTGRSVRSDSDWAATYILDSMFMVKMWRDRKMFFPEWWREAVDLTFNVKALMRGEKES